MLDSLHKHVRQLAPDFRTSYHAQTFMLCLCRMIRSHKHWTSCFQNIPQGVKDICAELEKEEGIDSVVLGRQAEERRVVSQVKPDACVVLSVLL